MEREEARHLIERLRGTILRPLVKDFELNLEELRNEPIDIFLDVLSPVLTDARMEFNAMLEMLPDKQLTHEQMRIFYGYTVYDFNSIMPPDYTYIMGIANIVSEQRICFVYLFREAITERFSEIPAGAIPIISIENAEDLSTGNFLRVDLVGEPDDIRIISPDS